MITRKWLKNHCAFDAGIKWFEKNVHDDIEISALVEKLMLENGFSLANWLLANNLNKGHNIKYAVFAARQVLSIYEKEYPEDKRPREAIESAEGYLRCPSKKAAHAAAHAAAAASATAHTAYMAASAFAAVDDAAYMAASAVSEAAYAAVYASHVASHEAYAAAYASHTAVDSAVDAAVDAAERMRLGKVIIDFGLSLIE